MSSLLDLAVFPGKRRSNAYNCRKAVAFGEGYKMNFYVRFTITKNAKAMAEAFVKEVTISFQEVHNHMMLIDLRNKGFLEKKKMH
jgi:glycine/serine hydroxymethyltransferase